MTHAPAAGAARLRWAVDVARWAPGAAEWQCVLGLLPAADAARVVRFVHEEDRKRALVSALLQRAACAVAVGVPFCEAAIERTRGGKPFLATPHGCAAAPNWNFNVSHEGRLVILAAEPLRVCGVDVAAPSQLRRAGAASAPQPVAELLRSFSRQLTPAEQRFVLAQSSEEARGDAFRVLWSLKEAFVKARGDGLAFELGRAEFTLRGNIGGGELLRATVAVDGAPQPQWRFSTRRLGQPCAEGHHWATVATCPPTEVVDAAGAFRATLRAPAAGVICDGGGEDGCEPPFSLLTVHDLLPEDARAAFVDAGGDGWP